MIIGVASADHLRADKFPDGVEQWGGAGWARVGQYLPFYGEAGHSVHTGIVFLEDDGIHIQDFLLNKHRPDVIIMQRLMHDTLDEAIRYAQSCGQVIINDLDDWYWGLDQSNIAFKASHSKWNPIENTKHYHKVINASDLLTVSTPWLAQKMASRVDCPILTIGNYVDPNRFTPVVQQEKPTMGWAGSTHHRSGDLETLRGVLLPFVQRGEYSLHHSGAMGDPTFASKVGVPDDLCSTSPRTSARDYPSMLTFDVGLVPLRDTAFNHAKSAIKGMEYAASGIPFVAQALPSYVDLYEEWGEGFLVARKPKDWVRALRRLQDLDVRQEYSAQLLDSVQGKHLRYGAVRWLETLEGLVSERTG